MRATWTGALDLGGFPVNVNLYNRTADKRGQSFRLLSPNDGGPVSQFYVDAAGSQFKMGECDKGVEVGPDEYKVLSPEALKEVAAAERTALAEPAKFAALDSIDLTVNTGQFKVTPDPKVAGSENSYAVLWNGLREGKLAYITQIVMRAGAVDGIVALYAGDDAIYAVALPFAEQINEVPEVAVEADAKASKVFGAFVEANYSDLLGEFDRSEFVSAHAERREAVIASVLDGKAVAVPTAAKPAPETPSLMEALEASLADQPKPKAKAKAKPKAKAKVAAKV